MQAIRMGGNCMKCAQCNYDYYLPPTMFIFVKCDTYHTVILHE